LGLRGFIWRYLAVARYQTKQLRPLYGALAAGQSPPGFVSALPRLALSFFATRGG